MGWADDVLRKDDPELLDHFVHAYSHWFNSNHHNNDFRKYRKYLVGHCRFFLKNKYWAEHTKAIPPEVFLRLEYKFEGFLREYSVRKKFNHQ